MYTVPDPSETGKTSQHFQIDYMTHDCYVTNDVSPISQQVHSGTRKIKYRKISRFVYHHLPSFDLKNTHNTHGLDTFLTRFARSIHGLASLAFVLSVRHALKVTEE